MKYLLLFLFSLFCYSIIKRSVNEKSVSLDFIGSVWYL